jgi:uncharacterized Zn finger protein
MTQTTLQSLVRTVAQQASTARLQKAVCGLADGSLTVTLTRQSDTDIRALVQNGDGKAYGVSIVGSAATCSCPDALFRGVVCKHITALALHVLRPHPAPQPRTYHVGDTVEHHGHTGRVIAVSGEYVSIWWNNGRTYPLTRDELTA